MAVSRAADTLTLARVAAGLALPLALARAVDRPGGAWTPLGLWTVGAASDLLDGPLARRLGGATRHGAFLDSVADVLFVLGASSTGAALGLLSGWVPAAIGVAFAAYALAGLLAGSVALPSPSWPWLLAGASTVVVFLNLTAVVQRLRR